VATLVVFLFICTVPAEAQTTPATITTYLSSLSSSVSSINVVSAYNTSTFVGSGTAGYADGIGSLAMFDSLYGGAIALDAAGNLIISDYWNQRIRKITPAGVVTTVAGSGSRSTIDGYGTLASFALPCGIALDSSGNIYVAATATRKIYPNNGSVTTFDTTSTLAVGLAIDSADYVYVGDESGRRVWKKKPNGSAVLLAGSGANSYADGTGTAAIFTQPDALAVDSAGNVLVADFSNGRVRKVSPTGVVTTLAGSGVASSADGLGTAASFNGPLGIAVDSAGNVYESERAGLKIRLIRPSGMVTTLAGTGASGQANGVGTAATFKQPTGVAVDSAGNVYVLDYTAVRKMTLMFSTGSLPNLAAYTTLTSLKISGLNTILSGTIPDMFAGMTALTSLDLSGNALSGTLPPSLPPSCSTTALPAVGAMARRPTRSTARYSSRASWR